MIKTSHINRLAWLTALAVAAATLPVSVSDAQERRRIWNPTYASDSLIPRQTIEHPLCNGIQAPAGERQTRVRLVNTRPDDGYGDVGFSDIPHSLFRASVNTGQIHEVDIPWGTFLIVRYNKPPSLYGGFASRFGVPRVPTVCVVVPDRMIVALGQPTADGPTPPSPAPTAQTKPTPAVVEAPPGKIETASEPPKPATVPRPADPFATLGPTQAANTPPNLARPRPVAVNDLGRPNQCPAPRLSNPLGNLPKVDGTLPLAAGQSIAKGQTFRSADGYHLVKLTNDGRFVAEWTHNGNPSSGAIGLGSNAARVEMRADGRLHVVYDNGDSRPIFPSNAKENDAPGTRLSVNALGRLTLINDKGEQVFPAIAATPVSTAPRVEIVEACTADETLEGWPRCLRLKDFGVTIHGSAMTTQAAMTSVSVVYHEMLSRLYRGYPIKNLDEFKVYMTNGETVDQLNALSRVGTFWPTNEEKNRLRGGASQRDLWISEQMICKHGVATRSEDAAACRGDGLPDHEYRLFDQVVHEMAHSIDMNGGRNDLSKLLPWNGKVEEFAWEVQARFGTRGGGFREGLGGPRAASMRGIFPTAVTFSCDGYFPRPDDPSAIAPRPPIPAVVQAPSQVPTTPVVQATAKPATTPAEQEQNEMLRLVNEFRSQPRTCGGRWLPKAPSLQLDDILSRAAALHSEDMGQRNYFSHFTPERRGPGARAKAAGYPHDRIGENIAAGRKTVEEAFNAWVKSPPHCRNMMFASSSRLGFGHALVEGSRYTHYWTQKFSGER